MLTISLIDFCICIVLMNFTAVAQPFPININRVRNHEYKYLLRIPYWAHFPIKMWNITKYSLNIHRKRIPPLNHTSKGLVSEMARLLTYKFYSLLYNNSNALSIFEEKWETEMGSISKTEVYGELLYSMSYFEDSCILICCETTL